MTTQVEDLEKLLLQLQGSLLRDRQQIEEALEDTRKALKIVDRLHKCSIEDPRDYPGGG